MNVFLSSCVQTVVPISIPDMSYTQVNDTAKSLAFHSFNYTSTDEWVQLFFDPSLVGMWFKIYVKYDGWPNINDFEFESKVPRDVPDNLPMEQDQYEKEFENYTTPYSFILPKNFTNKLGLITVGVLVQGRFVDNFVP